MLASCGLISNFGHKDRLPVEKDFYGSDPKFKVNEKIPVNFNRDWLRHYPRETIFRPVLVKFAGKEKKNCSTCLVTL